MTTMELPQWLLDTRYWELRDGNQCYALVYGEQQHSGEFWDRPVTAAELEAIHPLLPDAVMELLKYTASRDKESLLIGSYVTDTLSLMNNEAIEFINIKGDHKKILDVGVVLEGNLPNSVTISGRELTTIIKVLKEKSVDLVVMANRFDNNVMKDELESRYPGWEQRWQIGEGLGIAACEIASEIFSNKPALDSKPLQSDITFD